MRTQNQFIIAAAITTLFLVQSIAKLVFEPAAMLQKHAPVILDIPAAKSLPEPKHSPTPKVSYDLDLFKDRVIYQVSFSGQLVCPMQPCAGKEVTIKVQIAGQKEMEAKTQSNPDGRYQLEMAQPALPDQQLDWTVSARHQPSEGFSGRRILTDNTEVLISQDITL